MAYRFPDHDGASMFVEEFAEYVSNVEDDVLADDSVLVHLVDDIPIVQASWIAEQAAMYDAKYEEV